ncbi:hypothetical protein RMB13_06965 [Acinetobacter sp. V102_4]|uniref:hypothetical protein n=1 Tax=Acinetobacter sp. V102_4 TaxID=3072984 RepID=UPI00287DAA0D|nr:hypothetical protein [Acinetobacter sp. V102_4]MDS7929218.1 hypothetical protein [Acinetobacter sp. V102_4]
MSNHLKKSIALIAPAIFLFSSVAHAFDVYQFINWRYYKTDSGKVVYTKDNTEFQNYLKTYNIKKMDVKYGPELLTNGQADPRKIKLIAEKSKQNPSMPICFDIEIGNAHKPETNLPVILDALKLYKKYGGAAPVGVYGVLPQRTPNSMLSSNWKNKYSTLNDQYSEIAKNVDFLSPTLYFYNLKDMNVWKAKAQFNMIEAQRYAKRYNLKIIPFISLSTWNVSKGKYKIDPLSETNMNQTINYLKGLGADGVVVWESGTSIQDSDNKAAIFDVNKAAFRSVVKAAQ